MRKRLAAPFCCIRLTVHVRLPTADDQGSIFRVWHSEIRRLPDAITVRSVVVIKINKWEVVGLKARGILSPEGGIIVARGGDA